MTTPTDQAIAALEFYANRYTWDSTKQRTNITAADIDHGERARDALTALRAPVEGDWVSVPREPTEAMLEAAANAPDDDDWIGSQRKAYKAMLAAAPPPAAGGMKAEDLYRKYSGLFRVGKSFEAVEMFKLIQADALATQPEARPDNWEEKS